MDVNQTSCGDHFTLYTNIESLCRTPETNRILCQLYLNKKNLVQVKVYYIKINLRLK